jgi:predicted ATP-grasp superfamily ATP-dependent carboligase
VCFNKRLSVLLASGSFGGTIAAARLLGTSGVKVGILSNGYLCAAAWSHHTVHSYSTPSEGDGPRFLDRLLAIGAADPGQIILPTSDQTAWLYTVNAPLLRQYFCVYQPSVATIRHILDKKLFSAAATAAGLLVLPSWYPSNLDDVAALAPTLPYPILIKPRTHVHRLGNDKGLVVDSASELTREYQEYIDREQARSAESPLLEDGCRFMLQQFVSTAHEGVYSVSGFIDQTGELFVTRAATKVFQRSQPVGVGVCFESRPTDPDLSDAVRRLCRELGYFGMFEVEFIRFEGRWAAIDFNPRLFNQIGMDIRRGMPLPLLACLDAAGETTALRKMVEAAQADDWDARTVFYDRFTLNAILLAKTMSAKITGKERAFWRAWKRRNKGHAVDFVFDIHDPMPTVIHALSEIYLGCKALPRFMRSAPPAFPAAPQAFARGASP